METPSKPLVNFEVHDRITVATVRAASVLDALNVTEFGAQVLGYVASHPGLHLLLNFENVKYLSSAALTELLRINEAVAECKGTLRLVGLVPDIRNVFHITNLDKVFVIYQGTLKEALRKHNRSLAVTEESEAWTEPGKG